MKFKKTIATSIATILLATGAVSAHADEKAFSDVKKGDWYYESIQKLVKFNIINGFSDNTFRPKQEVTRAQAASIIANTLGVNMKDVKNPNFKDVSKQNSHYKSIAKLTELGIFAENEKFNPEKSLTRAQMAKILVEAFDLKSQELQTFTDVHPDDWYYEYAGILGALGITTNKGEFNPNAAVGRANLAAFIERVVNLKQNNDQDDHLEETGDKNEKPKEDNVKEDQNADYKENDNEQIKTYRKALEDAADDVKDVQADVEKALKDLKEAIEEDDEEEIEEEKDELQKVLIKLNTEVANAENILKEVRYANFKELESSESYLENVIRKAKKAITEAYANTFDKEIHEEKFEDAIELLEDEINDAEKAIREGSTTQLEKAYTELQKAIEKAEDTISSYRNSTVNTLDEVEDELDELIDEAEDVLDEAEKLLKSKFEEREEYLEQVIENLEDAIKELKNALRDEDKGDIRKAENNLEDEIERAESILDRFRDMDIDMLEDELDELNRVIKKAKEQLEKSYKN